ncbi:MAG: hypothetical protein IJX38_06180 [Clostridia bacterium]|nr:hypothetical protein [Clostridia bacterium]
MDEVKNTTEKAGGRIARRVGIISLIVLGAIVALVFLVWGGLNLLKFAIYSDYYSIEETLCDNPGLGDGFVCQGIAISEEDGKILVSGYMKDKSASRIYITDLDDNSHYITLRASGEDFTGHVGGIAVSGDRVFLANGGRLHEISLDTLLSLSEGDSIDVGEGIEVGCSASFVYADENFVYVGEFHDGGKYVTEHPYETPDGLYHAIIAKYSLADLTAPIKIYSVRDKVQGVCFTPDGRVILSTSYGLSSTVYYVYDEADAIPSGNTLDGAPVYYLNGVKQEIKGPAMGEDLDWYDGGVITLTESASDKYIFGKFFFANDIVKLDFWQLKNTPTSLCRRGIFIFFRVFFSSVLTFKSSCGKIVLFEFYLIADALGGLHGE